MVKVVISKGDVPVSVYQKYGVNELGKVPIMMYHGIVNMKSSDTNYVGGNVDKDGYNRTTEAFRADLEFYYHSGYRMIRLDDYIEGNIDVEFGKSPIILTFDDGLSNNIKINGIDEEGNLIIDPNCAVGILESFKEKYNDYNVTATFFINAGLFGQPEYNEKIIKWLVENGYDIGNHTYSHVDFTKVDSSRTQVEVGAMYEILNNIIPNSYVNIVALPFGSPYSLNHDNMQYIFNSSYNGNEYSTKATLRVGWEAESSPFSSEFNSKFLKRIRAYDNNGEEFDIEINFELLESTRYISDGDKEKIVIPSEKVNFIGDVYSKELITY
jgi:peptidoglycan/xylan/chitin deacetylase (PgdA/CDA1 family)